MVIQCKQCETTYNLDEALLANGSIDVRCVRCKNVFTVSATAPQIESISTFQAEMPSPAEEQAPLTLQQEEPALPEWNSAEDNFSFAEADSFSFDEESTEQAENTEQVNNDGELSFASKPSANDSLPQEFSFESIAPDIDSAQQSTSTSNDNKPEKNTPDAVTTDAPNKTEKKPAPQTKDKPNTSKSAWFLLFIVMLVAGAYGYGYVTYGTADVMQMIHKVQQQFVPAPQQSQNSIRVDTSESYYVENSAAGQLFIIQGHAVNNFPGPRSELKVVATLYKEKGIPLLNQSAYCGNIISKSELENLPLQELLDTINNPFGAALSNVNIAPGQSLPFMVVFSTPPDSLTEFSVEAESSTAAAK